MMRNYHKAMKFAAGVLFMSLSGTMLTSCDVHQFPEASLPDTPVTPTPPEDPAETSIMKLRLVYSPDLYIWEHTYDTQTGKITEQNPSLDLFPDYPGTSDKYSNVIDGAVMEIHVKVVDNRSNEVAYETYYKTADEETGYDTEVSLELESGKDYTVTAWSHLLENDAAFPFYDASDFNSVKLVEERFAGNTDYRDGYRGKVTVTAAELDNVTKDVPMSRPMAKFEFVTTDLSEFLEIEAARRGASTRSISEDYIVVISYPAYYPDSYSAYDDRLENANGGYNFTSVISTEVNITGENEASLGFDYVLVNNIDDAAVQAQLAVYDKDGNKVASTSMLTIPLRRDHHTVLRGTFLTTNGGGGIGIDPGFDGDHNITI